MTAPKIAARAAGDAAPDLGLGPSGFRYAGVRVRGNHGHSADEDVTDAVQRGEVRGRVAVDGEQVGVVAGRDPALAVAEAA